MAKISLTTDAVIFAETNAGFFILLIQRKNKPFQGKWALPGGFLEAEETLQAGCQRELKEETGLCLTNLERVGIYDAVKRDPRGRMISVAFTAKLDHIAEVSGSDDAAMADWKSLKKLPDLAFDHAQIIRDAANYFGIQIQ